MFVFASLNHTSLSPSVMFSAQQICQGQTGLVDHVHRGTLQLCVWVSTVTGSNNNWRFAASCLMLAESVLVRRGRWFILNINLLKHCIGTKTKGSINTVFTWAWLGTWESAETTVWHHSSCLSNTPQFPVSTQIQHCVHRMAALWLCCKTQTTLRCLISTGRPMNSYGILSGWVEKRSQTDTG